MNLNTQFMVHVGTEFVIIAGVTFWLNKKINAVQDENHRLTEKVGKIEETLAQYRELLSRHEMVLRGGPQPAPPPPNTKQPPVKKEEQKVKRRINKEVKKPLEDKNNDSDADDKNSDMDEVNNSDLDNAMQSELENIVKNRKKSS
jgi:hypothetical protein